MFDGRFFTTSDIKGKTMLLMAQLNIGLITIHKDNGVILQESFPLSCYLCERSHIEHQSRELEGQQRFFTWHMQNFIKTVQCIDAENGVKGLWVYTVACKSFSPPLKLVLKIVFFLYFSE